MSTISMLIAFMLPVPAPGPSAPALADERMVAGLVAREAGIYGATIKLLDGV